MFRGMPPRKPKDLIATITPAEWDRIVSVYQRHGGYSIRVAQELGWNDARARRIFYRGLPSRGFPPIRTLIAMDGLVADQIRAKRSEFEEAAVVMEDQHAAYAGNVQKTAKRSAVVEVKAQVIEPREQERLNELVRREDERAKARADAVKSRAEEALLVSANRRNAIALNGVTARLMRGARSLSETIERELQKVADNEEIPVEEKLRLLKSAAQIARFNSEATMLAIKSERMVLGQPIEVDPANVEEDSLDQAAKWIETSIRAVQLARQRGLLGSGSQGDEK